MPMMNRPSRPWSPPRNGRAKRIRSPKAYQSQGGHRESGAGSAAPALVEAGADTAWAPAGSAAAAAGLPAPRAGHLAVDLEVRGPDRALAEGARRGGGRLPVLGAIELQRACAPLFHLDPLPGAGPAVMPPRRTRRPGSPSGAPPASCPG